MKFATLIIVARLMYLANFAHWLIAIYVIFSLLDLIAEFVEKELLKKQRRQLIKERKILLKQIEQMLKR